MATFTQQGVDFVTDGWVGYAAAAGMPATVLNQLNAALVKVLRKAEVVRRFTGLGFTVVASDRAGFRQAIVDSTKVYEELLKSGDIKVTP